MKDAAATAYTVFEEAILPWKVYFASEIPLVCGESWRGRSTAPIIIQGGHVNVIQPMRINGDERAQSACPLTFSSYSMILKRRVEA